jgi:hypothetical protein
MLIHRKTKAFELVVLKRMYREDKLPKIWDTIIFPNNENSIRIVIDIKEVTEYQEVKLIVTLIDFKESKYKLINLIKLQWLKLKISVMKITSKLISMIQNVSA